MLWMDTVGLLIRILVLNVGRCNDIFLIQGPYPHINTHFFLHVTHFEFVSISILARNQKLPFFCN
jgi:hypothetical protein